MKSLCGFLVIAWLVMALASVVYAKVSASNCQDTINGLTKVLDAHRALFDLRTSGKWRPKDPRSLTAITREQFDASQLLSVFPNLSLFLGKTLDFVYHKDDLGGKTCSIYEEHGKRTLRFV